MPAERHNQTETASDAGACWSWRRLAPLGVALALAAVVFAMGWHRELSLENLVRHRATLDAFVEAHQWTAVALFVAAYVAVVALSLPCAAIMTLASGVLFGTLAGGGASVIGATLGAAAIFLIAKTAFGAQLAQRAGSVAERLAEGFRKDAFNYLLFLRLVPVFPFFVVNLAAAVLGVRLATFIVATSIGIIPASFAFAMVGAGLDSVIGAQEVHYRACLEARRADCRLDFDIGAALTPELIAAFVALGVVALIPVVMKRLRERRIAAPSG